MEGAGPSMEESLMLSQKLRRQAADDMCSARARNIRLKQSGPMTTRTTTAVEFSRTRLESHHTAPLAHAPRSVLLGKQKGSHFAECGLMPDNERGLARVGPAGRSQHRANARRRARARARSGICA